MNQIFSRHVRYSFSGLLALAAGLLSPAAHADRVVDFYGAAQNTFYDSTVSPSSTMVVECAITITNVGPTPQVVTITFTSTRTIGGTTTPVGPVTMAWTNGTPSSGTIGTLASGTPSVSDTRTIPVSTGSPTTNQDTIVYTWTPETFNNTYAPSVATSDSVICQGNIVVRDQTAGTPGFITAMGYLTTFTESAGGKYISGNGPHNGISANAGVANPSQTSIVIGEGRPF